MCKMRETKEMKSVVLIIMLPFAIIWAMVVDLVRVVRGKPIVDEEWHNIYMDGNMNHGQGRKK